MPVVPFIPLIASTVGGLVAGKQATNAAQNRSPEEMAALGGAQGAAGSLAGAGGNLLSRGLGGTSAAMGYYNSLLTGNRSLMRGAVAGPTAALTDQYAGAARGIDRSGLRGATRDVAKADTARQGASQIAGLTTGVQPAAAGALGSLGTSMASQGLGATQGAGGLYSNLLGAGTSNRYYARQQGGEMGSGIGSLIFDVLNGTAGRKRAVGAGPGNSLPMSQWGTTPGPGAGIPMDQWGTS